MRLNNRLRDTSKKRPGNVIFKVMLGVIALTFALFYLVGYNNYNPAMPLFNAPLLTDLLMVVMILFVVASPALMLWSSFKGKGNKKALWKHEENRVPKGKIVLITACGVAALMVLTYIFASTKTMTINGNMFGEKAWLRLAGMFLSTTIVMLIVAICAIIVSYIRAKRADKSF